MSAAVSGLERVGESSATAREAVPIAGKTTAFELLLGSVLNHTQERDSGRNEPERPAFENTPRSDDSDKKADAEATARLEKSEREEQSAVAVYAYGGEQPVFSVEEYSGAVAPDRNEPLLNERREAEPRERAEEGTAEGASGKSAESSQADKNSQAAEAQSTEKGGGKNAETEEAEDASEEVSEDGTEEVDAEGAEDMDAEIIEQAVSAEEEVPVEEAEGEAVLQPIAAEEEAPVEVEEGDASLDGEAGEQSVGLVERSANGEETLEEEQDTSEEHSGQEGSAHAAEMTVQASSARVAEEKDLNSDFLAEMMQQVEVPRAGAGHEAVARIEQIQQLADRFDQHILSMIRSASQDMTITISPESLGKLVVHCHEEPDGVRVHVHVENASVCNLLQQQESGIRQALNQNGFKLAEFDVSTENGESAEQRRGRMMNEREDEQQDMRGGGRVASGEEKEAAPAKVTQRMDRNGVWLIA